MGKTVDIPWPTSPSKDTPARAGVGRMLNVILEQMADGRIMRRRAPGLSLLSVSSSASVHCRGFVLANASQLLVVYNGFVELVTITLGVVSQTPLGQLDGTKLIFLAKNNKTPTPDIVAVTELAAFILSTSGAPVSYPDPDVGSPNSVTFGDGYFFFTYGNGVCIASGLNSTTINPLDVIQINSKSDGCVRGIYFAQTLFLFTPSGCEAWINAANPTGFPFSRAAVIPRGLISATAIAGFEDSFTSSLLWVASDNIVYIMRGYEPVRISTNDMERRIQAVADKTTLRASVYMNNGHAYWQLTSSDFTFVYDLTNSVWLERDSYGQPFSRIEQGIYFQGNWIVGDYATGNLGIVSNEAFLEYADPLVYELTSHVINKFPERARIARLDINQVVGVGIPHPEGIDSVEVDPTMDISWSLDGGASFRMPVQRALGQQGRYDQVIAVLRVGQINRYGLAVRIRISDPVFCGIIGGTVEAI